MRIFDYMPIEYPIMRYVLFVEKRLNIKFKTKVTAVLTFGLKSNTAALSKTTVK